MGALNPLISPSYTIKATSLALGGAGAAMVITPGATKKVALIGISVDSSAAIDVTVSRYNGGSVSGGSGTAVNPVPHHRLNEAAECSASKYTSVPTPASGTETELLARPVPAAGSFVWEPKEKWQQPLIFDGVTDFLLIKGSGASSLDINLEIVEF